MASSHNEEKSGKEDWCQIKGEGETQAEYFFRVISEHMQDEAISTSQHYGIIKSGAITVGKIYSVTKVSEFGCENKNTSENW